MQMITELLLVEQGWLYITFKKVLLQLATLRYNSTYYLVISIAWHPVTFSQIA